MHHLVRRPFVSAVLLASVHLSVPAQGQVPTALLVEGGPVPGAPGETVTFLTDPMTNDVGGFACFVRTDGEVVPPQFNSDLFWGSATAGTGDVLRRLETLGGTPQVSFLTPAVLMDSGTLVYRAQVASGGAFPDGIWSGDVRVAQRGDPVPNTGGSYGNVRLNGLDSGLPVFWSNQAGNVTTYRGSEGEILYASGDLLPGLPMPISYPFDLRFSPDGSEEIGLVLLQVDFGILTAAIRNGQVLTLDGSPILTDGNSAVPASAGGLPGEVWHDVNHALINDAGQWTLTGATRVGMEPVSPVIVQDGVVAYRVDDVVDGLTLRRTSSSQIHTATNEAGDLLFSWRVFDPVPGGVQDRNALFFNGQRVFTAGDLVDLDGDLVGETEIDTVREVALSERKPDGSVDAYFLGYSVLDPLGGGGPALRKSFLTLNIQPPECFLVIGPGPGGAPFQPGGHAFQTQLSEVTRFQPVLLEDLGELPLPGSAMGPAGSERSPEVFGAPSLVASFSAQVLMHNPRMFPANPEQYSRPIHVGVFSDGSVRSRTFGSGTGMELSVERAVNANGEPVLRFPFTIPGF